MNMVNLKASLSLFLFPFHIEGCRDGSCSNFSIVCVSSVNRNPKDAAKHTPPHLIRSWSVKQRMCLMPFFVAVTFWLGVFMFGFCCCLFVFQNGPTWNDTFEVLKRNLKLAALFFPNYGVFKCILLSRSILLYVFVLLCENIDFCSVL